MEFVPELNDKQLDRISEFLSNFSLLVIATLILPNIFGLNKPNINDLISGILLTILTLTISMIILRKNYEWLADFLFNCSNRGFGNLHSSCSHSLETLKKEKKVAKQKGLAPVLIVLILASLILLIPIPYYQNNVLCLPGVNCPKEGWYFGDPLYKKIYAYFYSINKPGPTESLIETTTPPVNP